MGTLFRQEQLRACWTPVRPCQRETIPERLHRYTCPKKGLPGNAKQAEFERPEGDQEQQRNGLHHALFRSAEDFNVCLGWKADIRCG
jgi:hypothetical protein